MLEKLLAMLAQNSFKFKTFKSIPAPQWVIDENAELHRLSKLAKKDDEYFAYLKARRNYMWAKLGVECKNKKEWKKADNINISDGKINFQMIDEK